MPACTSVMLGIVRGACWLPSVPCLCFKCRLLAHQWVVVNRQYCHPMTFTTWGLTRYTSFSAHGYHVLAPVWTIH